MDILFNREYAGSRGRGFGSVFGSRSNFLENLKCVREDQHLTEGISNEDIVPPLACSFNTVKTNLVAIANEDGGITILDTHLHGLKGIREEWRAHENAIFDVEWAGEHLLTASGDQTAQLWDLPSETSISTFKGHASSLKTIRCSHDPNVFATGARDGHIMVWDARVKAKGGSIPAVNIIQNAHTIRPPDGGSATKKKRHAKSQPQHHSQQSVTAVVFQDEHTLITSGSVDGSVKLWDLRKNYTILKSEPIAVHKFPYAGNCARFHGFSSLVLDSTKTRLFANCMDNTVYLYDCAGLNTKPVATYRGHTNNSFYVKMSLSPDDVFILSGSTDKNAYIWRVDEPQRSPLELRGHTDEVSAVAWSPSDYTTIVTLSDDCTVFTWRPHFPGAPTEQVVEQQVIGTAEWTRKDVGVGAGRLGRPWTPATPCRHARSPAASPLSTPQRTPRHRRTGVTPEAVGLSPRLTSPHVTGVSRLVGSPGISPRAWLSASVFSHQSGSVTPTKTPGDLMKSPLKSPRQIHLLLSPRKTPIAGCFDALSPRKTSLKTQSPLSRSASARSVKRKLCEDEDEPVSQSKRIRPDPNLAMAGVTPLGALGRPLAPTENITPVKKLAFSDRSPNKVPQSPTVNLPNYVLNPESRTPQLPRPSTQKENSQRNWLVEMRQRKQAEKGDSDVDPASTATPAAVGATPGRRGSPAGRATPARRIAVASRATPVDKSGAAGGITPLDKAMPRMKATPSGQVTPRRTPGASASNKKTKSTSKAATHKTPTSRRSILSYFSPKDMSK